MTRSEAMRFAIMELRLAVINYNMTATSPTSTVAQRQTAKVRADVLSEAIAILNEDSREY